MSKPEEKMPPRAKDRYLEVSGPDNFGRAKTHVVFTYREQYSDGTSKTLRELTISQKPIVQIFRHAGFINVLLDFKSMHDMDLCMAWKLLQDYAQPINSIDWTEEELESGAYIDENGSERLIWFPLIEMAISPVRRETEFMILGINPAFFTLQPSTLKGEPCVLQLTFQEDWFHVSEKNPYTPAEMDALRQEVREELEEEQRQSSDLHS